MIIKRLIATALFLLFAGLALADSTNGQGGGQVNGNGGGHGNVPEIDGALSIQMIALLGGVLYLLKRKK